MLNMQCVRLNRTSLVETDVGILNNVSYVLRKEQGAFTNSVAVPDAAACEVWFQTPGNITLITFKPVVADRLTSSVVLLSELV